MRLLPSHPALLAPRTIHTSRRRDPATNKADLLKSVADNDKLGNGTNIISKGAWRGFPLFALTLEERATCPSDCERWDTCYGNGMPFAHRFQHGKPLEDRLRLEVASLAARYPKGFAVRLHVLGDFYSIEYVQLWRDLLATYPNLHVYGYTAHYQGKIADAIRYVRINYDGRFMVRFSRSIKRTNDVDIFAVKADHAKELGAIVCPEQTGKVKSCLECGLCWAVNISIGFIEH